MKKVCEKGVFEFLWCSVFDDGVEFGGEISVKQVFDCLVGVWVYWGWKGGYFLFEGDV